MKKLLVGCIGLALFAATAWSQSSNFKIHTTPAIPSRESLDRLGLTLAWSARIILDGNRDGFYSIQVIPGRDYPQLLIQSYSGKVMLLDGETGDTHWKVQVGAPYRTLLPGGYNSRSIFVTRRDVLHILNRATGQERVYTTDKLSGLRTYGFEMPYTPSSAPVADDGFVYFVMSSRVLALDLPAYGAGDKLSKQEQGAEATGALVPDPLWTYLIGDEFVQFPPLLGGNQVSVATASGTVLSLNKYNRQLRDEFATEGRIVVAPGQHGVMAYIGTDNATLFAYNMDNSKLVWRFLPGSAVRKPVAVTDRDVFVASDQVGLYRVQRDNGREAWMAKQLDRFLAANDNYVYALHHSGELHVLDYLRGSTLASQDMRDWNVPVVNELTDRIYLASNDGQIICLRHRDLKLPLRNKTIVTKKDEKKDDKKDDKKDEKKDEKGAGRMDRRPPTMYATLDGSSRVPILFDVLSPIAALGERRFAP